MSEANDNLLGEIKEKMIAKVLENFHKSIRNQFATPANFTTAMIFLDRQCFYQEGYGGFIPPELIGWCFAGGIDECVLSNVYYGLGLKFYPFNGAEVQLGFTEIIKLYPMILAEAMRRDGDLMLFIKSTINGAMRRGRNFTSPDEQKILRELMQQFPEVVIQKI